jgi:hypothetical protein
MPDLSIMREGGFTDYELIGWFGLLATGEHASFRYRNTVAGDKERRRRSPWWFLKE